VRKVLPRLAAEKPEIFNAHQQTQNPRAEKVLMKADVVACSSVARAVCGV